MILQKLTNQKPNKTEQIVSMNVSVHENQGNFSQRLCDMFDVVGGSIEQKFSSSNRECQYEFRKVRYTYMLKLLNTIN